MPGPLTYNPWDFTEQARPHTVTDNPELGPDTLAVAMLSRAAQRMELEAWKNAGAYSVDIALDADEVLAATKEPTGYIDRAIKVIGPNYTRSPA